MSCVFKQEGNKGGGARKGGRTPGRMGEFEEACVILFYSSDVHSCLDYVILQ